MQRWIARGIKPIGISDDFKVENVSMENDQSPMDNSSSSSPGSESSFNQSVSGNLRSSSQLESSDCEENRTDEDSTSGDFVDNSLFEEEYNDSSSKSDNDDIQNKAEHEIGNTEDLRIKQAVIDISLYPDSEASVNETVLELIQMYLDRGCTQSILSYTLNMMLKTMPKNHNFPTSIYKLFQFVRNMAAKFTTIEHFYCDNADCMAYVGTQKSPCESCLDNSGVESFYEIDVAEQIKHMFMYRNLAEKLRTPTLDGNGGNVRDITDGTEYIRANSRPHRGPFDLTLILNTDGISLSKSSKSSCWPLMFMIAELPEHLREAFIVVAGIWYSKKLNPLMNTYLMPFCVKFHKYYHKGITWINPTTKTRCRSKIVVPLIIADAPARAKIQNVVNFNGRYGCNTCEVKMKKCPAVENKRTTRSYPFCEDIKLRNGQRMMKQAEKISLNPNLDTVKGVKGKSIISSLPCLDLGTCLPPEFMHSTLLGVGLQCLTLFFGSAGPWSVRKSAREIDSQLMKVRPPRCFSRMPRRILDNLKSLKANEIYNWILFYSCPLMQDYQNEKYFQHWLLFVESIFTLLQREIKQHELDRAHFLLKLFVRDFPILYGERAASYNVHQLLHLVLSVRRWGPLWAWSAFAFENFNGRLTRLSHGTKHNGKELINKIQLIRGIQILQHRIYENKKATTPIIQPSENDSVRGTHRSNIKLHDTEREILISKGFLDMQSCKIYLRGIVNDVEYTSLFYKETAYNSFTVFLKKQDNLSFYGIIRFFVLHDGDLCFVIQHLLVQHTKFILQHETQTKLSHIIPIREVNEFTFINVREVKEMYHMIRVKNFIIKRPNLFNKNL